tara:strand:- start:60107 stop:60886 length:780 start_codon:yes stop_codon:yes gene_type:complete
MREEFKIVYMENIDSIEVIAKDAAKILEEFKSLEIITEDDKDIKLVADIRLQKFIIDEIKKISPYPILSEELDNQLDIKKEDTFWVIDPLDGTYNFKHNIPFSCISIGLWKGGKPHLGVIYDFNHNNLYKGGRGFGSFLNSEKISVSSINDVSKSSISTGLPIKMNLSNSNFKKYALNLPIFKKVRMLGSAATSLAYVSKGSIDCYFEQNIFLWDVCAGLAICEGAGAEYSIQQTDNYLFNVLVSNKKIHQQLRTLWMN